MQFRRHRSNQFRPRLRRCRPRIRPREMIPIEQLDDPRIAAYRNLRDRTLRGESIFIAEGCVVVERLLRSR
jgi:hypothetical protein